MPRRHPSPFRKRARQLIGRPVYLRVPVQGSAGWESGGGDPRVSNGSDARRRTMLAIAYTGVRRPCICTGCICLTPAERARQRRVFALTRAVMRAHAAQSR